MNALGVSSPKFMSHLSHYCPRISSAGKTFPSSEQESIMSLYNDSHVVLQCLLAFVESSDTELSLQGLGRLRVCADHLAKGDLDIFPPVRCSEDSLVTASYLVVCRGFVKAGRNQLLLFDYRCRLSTLGLRLLLVSCLKRMLPFPQN